MTARGFALVTLVLVVLLASPRGTSQSDPSPALPFAALATYRPVGPRAVRPFSRVGLAWSAGIGGLGFDVATPVLSRFNARAGAAFFGYSTTFQDQGANVAIHLRMRSAHASLDWFPRGGQFRLSPLLVFANNNRVRATALIPAGNTITLDGQDYISSLTDPLHGAGSIDFRKVSPGFSLGWGDVVPRHGSHFSFPIEAGFYHVGQPSLKVGFTGSACDPTQPSSLGCQSVDQNSDFQQSLAAFVARNDHNLSYAAFLPVLSFGVGYSFYTVK